MYHALESAQMSRADRTAVVVIVVLPLLLLSPALVPGRVLSPLDQLFAVPPWRAVAPGPIDVDPAQGDVAQVFHPWTLYAAGEIRAGRWPLWNPYAYTGAPFFSNPQTALLFPLTALTWVLPASLALTAPSVLKLVAIGLSMYWMLRVLAVAPLAAFVGAAGLMLSSTTIGWLPWTLASTLAFLPLLFGAIERLAQDPTRRRVAVLALVVGLDALAGYPQATFHALLAAAAWTLARAPWRAGAAGFLTRVAAGVALGVGLAAAQALPALDYLRESAVFAYRAQWTAPVGVPAAAAVTTLMPAFFGTGIRRWSVWQFAITSTYVGLVPLLGVPLALLRWRIDVLALSDDEARSLGLPVGLLRAIVIACATLITASAVSLAGTIGWVGLVIPHAARLVTGAAFARVLPLSIVLGAAFMLGIDTLCRTAFATEIPPGVVTAFVGTPVFIALMAWSFRSRA